MIASDIKQKKRLFSRASKEDGIYYSEKLIYCYLEFVASKKNGCYPSIDKISLDCCISRPTVMKALNNLQNAFFIRIKKVQDKKKREKNYYEFLDYDEHMKLTEKKLFGTPRPEELQEEKELTPNKYDNSNYFYKLSKVLVNILLLREKKNKNKFDLYEGANILESLANKYSKELIKECIAFLGVLIYYENEGRSKNEIINFITTYRGFRQYFKGLKNLYENCKSEKERESIKKMLEIIDEELNKNDNNTSEDFEDSTPF